ncbi:hypothetical protein ACWCSH_28630, partial [Streptosporangium sp. NPDC001682]
MVTTPAVTCPFDIDVANAEAFERLTTADPWVVDVGIARDVIPGYADNLVLTSGAPMPWSEYVLCGTPGTTRPVLYADSEGQATVMAA